MIRFQSETQTRLRQFAAFVVLLLTGYLCLATSCDEGSDVEIASTLPVRFSAGQAQMLIEIEMSGAYVDVTSDGPLIFSPAVLAESNDDPGLGGAGGATASPAPPPEATMTYCWSVTEEPTASPVLGECVREPNNRSKKVTFLAERQGDANLPTTLIVSAAVHSGLSCDSGADDANGRPGHLSLKLRALNER